MALAVLARSASAVRAVGAGLWLVLLGLSLASAGTAFATTIAYDFTGTTTFQNGDFAGEGSAVTGTITFDDGLVDGNANGDVVQFNKTLAANALLAGSFSYSLTVGSVTKTGNGTGGPVAFLQLFDDATQASDSITFSVGTAPFDILTLRALQGSGLDVDLPAAPSGFNPMGDVLGILDNLGPSQFPNSTSIWGAGANQVQFTWETITLVPEPSTGVLLSLGIVGVSAWRRRHR